MNYCVERPSFSKSKKGEFSNSTFQSLWGSHWNWRCWNIFANPTWIEFFTFRAYAHIPHYNCINICFGWKRTRICRIAHLFRPKIGHFYERSQNLDGIGMGEDVISNIFVLRLAIVVATFIIILLCGTFPIGIWMVIMEFVFMFGV